MKGITHISIIMTTTANCTLYTITWSLYDECCHNSSTTKSPSFSQTIHGKYYNQSWGWTIYLGAECIIYYQSQANTAAEADDLMVIFKAVGNSWSILSAILGHKYHQNHPDKNVQPKSEFDHICAFPLVYVLLTFDLDLVSNWQLHLSFCCAPYMS